MYGILDSSPWQAAIFALLFTHLTIVSVTLYLHRAQAHRAVDFHPVLSHFFRFWLWLSTGMVTRQWVAVHRRHHAKCETREDPHSPYVFGLKRVLTAGAELYAQAARDPDTIEQYGHGTPNDWIECNLYSRYHWQGPFLMLVIDLGLFGVYGLTVWAVQMLWIPFFAAGVINGIGHYLGYRNFHTPDGSTNIFPWGILIGGEELHNNHHAAPGSARLSARPWEFDIGWFYLSILRYFRLAQVRKVAPPLETRLLFTNGSGTAPGALILARMYMLARYGREVLIPTTRSELCRNRRQCREIRRLFIFGGKLRDGELGKQLQRLLAESQTLAIVHQFGEALNEVLTSHAARPLDLKKALDDWRQRAEATGIHVLKHFSETLALWIGSPDRASSLSP